MHINHVSMSERHVSEFLPIIMQIFAVLRKLDTGFTTNSAININDLCFFSYVSLMFYMQLRLKC